MARKSKKERERSVCPRKRGGSMVRSRSEKVSCVSRVSMPSLIANALVGNGSENSFVGKIN